MNYYKNPLWAQRCSMKGLCSFKLIWKKLQMKSSALKRHDLFSSKEIKFIVVTKFTTFKPTKLFEKQSGFKCFNIFLGRKIHFYDFDDLPYFTTIYCFSPFKNYIFQILFFYRSSEQIHWIFTPVLLVTLDLYQKPLQNCVISIRYCGM